MCVFIIILKIWIKQNLTRIKIAIGVLIKNGKAIWIRFTQRHQPQNLKKLDENGTRKLTILSLMSISIQIILTLVQILPQDQDKALLVVLMGTAMQELVRLISNNNNNSNNNSNNKHLHHQEQPLHPKSLVLRCLILLLCLRSWFHTFQGFSQNIFSSLLNSSELSVVKVFQNSIWPTLKESFTPVSSWVFLTSLARCFLGAPFSYGVLWSLASFLSSH